MPKDKKISVLFVPCASRLAPGPRYRVYQYLPYLKEAGIPYRVFPINGEKTTRDMIASAGFSRVREIVYYFQVILEKIIRFFAVLFLARRYGIIFFHRTTFPFGLERIIRAVNKNIIFDIDDAIFLPDTEEKKGLIFCLKKILKTREIPAILKVSRWAVVENSYIKEYVHRYCKSISTIVGPINTKNIAVRAYPGKSDSGAIVIGWIGSPSTLPYLRSLDGVFKVLIRRYKLQVKVIGVDYELPGVDVVCAPWSEDTEWRHLSSFDIGVMPMPDDQWTRGKVGVKMLQYMAVGVPAVVSYTPTNEEVLTDGVNGFIVRENQDWEDKLSRLIENADLRERVGINGRDTVERMYSLDAAFTKLADVFGKILAEEERGNI